FDDARVVESRTSVSPLGRDVRQCQEDVSLGQREGRLPNPSCFARNCGAQFCEETAFDLNNLFFGLKHLTFVLLQLRRCKALGIYQGLFALELLRHEMQVWLGNFEVVTEDRVEFDLQRIDARSLALA